MAREPVYARNNPEYRIVSLPNNLWRVQELQPFQATRTFDPWLPLGQPKEYKDAVIALSRFNRK